MALYPSVRSDSSNVQGTDSTAWTLTYPATIVAGDLLYLFISNDGTATVSAAAEFFHVQYTNVAALSTARGTVLLKVASGSESGNFTLNVSTGEQGTWRIASIRDWHGSFAGGVEIGGTVTGSSANPDAGPVTASWGASESLWRTQFAADDGRHTVTTYPAGWTLNQNSDGSGGAQGASGGGASILALSASMNAGAFTSSRSDEWLAFTVVIRGAPDPPPTDGLAIPSELHTQFVNILW